MLCALPQRWGAPGRRFPVAGVPAGLDEDAAWNLVTNDQFGLARVLTPVAAVAAVANMSRRTLSRRFNWRAGSRQPPAAGEVVVRHDGRRKNAVLFSHNRARAQRMRLRQARTRATLADSAGSREAMLDRMASARAARAAADARRAAWQAAVCGATRTE